MNFPKFEKELGKYCDKYPSPSLQPLVVELTFLHLQKMGGYKVGTNLYLLKILKHRQDITCALEKTYGKFFTQASLKRDIIRTKKMLRAKRVLARIATL